MAKSRTRTGVPSQRIASLRSPITSVALSIIKSTAKWGGLAVRFEIGPPRAFERLAAPPRHEVGLLAPWTHSFDVRESWRWQRT